MSKFWNLLFCTTIIIIFSTAPAFAKKKGSNGEFTKAECLVNFEICMDTGCKGVADKDKCAIDCNTDYVTCADAAILTAKPFSKRAQDASKKAEGRELAPQQKPKKTDAAEQKVKKQ